MSYFSHKWQCQNFTWRTGLVAFYWQLMKNHLWNWCKKVWTWGGNMNFTKKGDFVEKSKKKMHQKWVAGCLCGQNMKNYEWNSCKKLWTWGGVNKFYITKLIFSKQSWKKNWKRLKKNEKNASKESCWVPLTWFEPVSYTHLTLPTN